MSNFLHEYRPKRSPDRTPEPMGSGAARPGVFVVQKHSATRMHYDLRLEWDGVLKSWAVPRGPHPDPAEKRLAMQTEDHPVEYADFEGVIPDGEYGAGPMIVWDRGLWRPVGDPREGVRAGKLLFELKGFKLKGMWTLVRIKGETGKEWLLIKETGDGHVRRGVAEPYEDSSILSGLAVEDLRERGKRAAEIRAACDRLKAPRRPVPGEDVQPMLAEPRSDPFDDPEWLFELKYDGFRAIASRDGARPRIFYRRGADSTAVFPDLARALLALPAERFVADGEIVVLDETGRPVFQRLQKRALLTAPRDVERAAAELPATLFLFDLLAFDDYDLRGLPLIERKKLLARLVPAAGPIRPVDHVVGQGRALYATVRELGLEGMVAKRAQSAYRSGRFRDWQKVRTDKLPTECVSPDAPPVTLAPREVPFSNLEKVFWPEEGYSKGDLIDYYRAVSPWLLPYLRDRPVVLTRYPDGIAGKSFFQKDAPDYVPAWVRTARVWSEDSGRDIDFFVCEDVETLLYVINLGTIPLHLWSAPLSRPQNPDWCIIDLDPKTAPFADVVTLANAVHELCEEIGLPSFCKTSGQKGLHVLLPVGGQLTHAQSTTLAELIARAVESRFPRIATTERHIPSRKGRVYLDYLQNGHGKTIAGPFSARPVPGAPVSMPLKRSEVNGKLDPGKFTLETAPARMKRLREDPLTPVLELNPDLQAVLARLAEKLK